jgi:hypothetical protein
MSAAVLFWLLEKYDGKVQASISCCKGGPEGDCLFPHLIRGQQQGKQNDGYFEMKEFGSTAPCKNSAQPPSGGQGQVTQVQVPSGYSQNGGQMMLVQSSSGQQMNVAVPQNHGPGGVFTVQFPGSMWHL